MGTTSGDSEDTSRAEYGRNGQSAKSTLPEPVNLGFATTRRTVEPLFTKNNDVVKSASLENDVESAIAHLTTSIVRVGNPQPSTSVSGRSNAVHDTQLLLKATGPLKTEEVSDQKNSLNSSASFPAADDKFNSNTSSMPLKPTLFPHRSTNKSILSKKPANNHGKSLLPASSPNPSVFDLALDNDLEPNPDVTDESPTSNSTIREHTILAVALLIHHRSIIRFHNI